MVLGKEKTYIIGSQFHFFSQLRRWHQRIYLVTTILLDLQLHFCVGVNSKQVAEFCSLKPQQQSLVPVLYT